MSALNSKKVALVTGGAVRLGRAVSLALGDSYLVAIHYNNSREQAESLSARLPGSKTFCYDLTRPGSAAGLINDVTDHYGRLDLLVNSAALFLSDSNDLAALAKMKLLNVDAPVRLIDEAAEYLAKTSGSIVNIADIAAMAPFSRYISYSKSKAALVDLTRRRALELAADSIRVNAVCPGIVLPAEREQGGKSEFSVDYKQLESKIPLGKTGTPRDITDTVLFLAASRFITGQIISVDGGRLLNYSGNNIDS